MQRLYSFLADQSQKVAGLQDGYASTSLIRVKVTMLFLNRRAINVPQIPQTDRKILSEPVHLRQDCFNQRHLAPAVPNLLQLQPGGLEKTLDLRWRPFNPVNTRHHGDIPAMAEPRVVAVVGRQRARG